MALEHQPQTKSGCGANAAALLPATTRQPQLGQLRKIWHRWLGCGQGLSRTQASLFSIELQRDFAWNKQAYKFSSFYDVGEVDKEKHATSTGLNSYKLQGIGLWLGASYPNAWGQSQWRVTWARRLGSNPGASNGNDADGTYYLNRFWLSASQMF
jgi:hypothetical protein